MKSKLLVFLAAGGALFSLGAKSIDELPLRMFNSGSLPESQFLEVPGVGAHVGFCSFWDPEFSFRGNVCCGKVPPKVRRRGIKCSPARSKRSFCDEMTDEQREYMERARSGELGDLLDVLKSELDDDARRQVYCEVSRGFLAEGRPVLESDANRIQLRRNDRCTNFGTDRMVAMLEWVGRELDVHYPRSEYPSVALQVGDISAPRGGCLFGRGGRRGHSSHQTGQDADIGFLNPKSRVPAGGAFTKQFDSEANWWFVKKIFENPFACVKVIFLDHRLISKLRKEAKDDPMWEKVRKHIRHVKNHRNHFHVRIGTNAGAPGCDVPPAVSDELEEEAEAAETGA